MWWWATIAVASAPAGVDLDDLSGWEQRARPLLDGPAGCWDLSGRATVQVSAYTPGGSVVRSGQHDFRSEGSFSGRIVDGEWQSFRYALDAVTGKVTLRVPLVPLEGRIDPSIVVDESKQEEGEESTLRIDTADKADAANFVDRTFASLDFSTALSWVEWRDDRGGLVLIEDVPLGDGRNPDTVRKTTLFPRGEPYGTEVDVLFPPKFKAGDGPKVTIMDGQAHLRGVVVDGVLLPGVSGMSVVVGLLGYTMGYEQRLLYQQARRCVASAE